MKTPAWTPALTVFDLDFTLWDCGGTWCDCLTPPFQRDTRGRVLDRHASHIRLYDDILRILSALDEAGCALGVASRTNEPTWAQELLGLLGVSHRFEYQAIYPGDKQQHFRQLQEQSGVAFEDMLFFDDEHRNIISVRQLGVRCVEVRQGVSWELLSDSLVPR